MASADFLGTTVGRGSCAGEVFLQHREFSLPPLLSVPYQTLKLESFSASHFQILVLIYFVHTPVIFQ